MTPGRLLSWTVVHHAPPGHPPGRVVGLVETAHGRVLAVAADASGLALDAEVVLEDGDPPTFRLRR